tara:strand:- start:1072 stop:1476 length:405 start_codon:yes stop_codon:yes gene_type:complete
MKELDKRTKEYKDWVKKHKEKSSGVGDTIEKITKVTGINKLAKWALGEDCGCDDRKKTLNHIFPYQKPNCLTENEYNYLNELFSKPKNTVSSKVQAEILQIFNRVFNERREMTSCSSCFLNGVYSKLERIFKEY